MSLDRDLQAAYLRDYPAEAAQTLGRLDAPTVAREIGGLGADVLLPVLDRLPPSRATDLLVRLDRDERREVLSLASPRLGVTMLSWIEPEERRATLEDLPDDVRADYERLLDFPENTAGRLMDRAVDTIRAGQTVAEALEQLRRSGLEHLRTLYAVDDENRLSARVDVQDLALAPHTALIDDLMRPIQAVASATDPRDVVVALLDTYRTDSVPVVDVDGRLLGVVRYAALFDAIEDTALIGLQTMVGASADERALSTPGFSVRRRLPWLHINLLTAFLAAAVVGLFESLIAQFTALAVLLPVVAGQSGNAGSQALAVTIRGLALKEIGTREWRQVLNKEVVVGIVNGLALALTCGGGVYLWSSSFGLAIVIGVAMVLSMIAAGVSGALVPVVLTRLGQDPATASSIILTTVTDVAGFFSFLGTATALSFML